MARSILALGILALARSVTSIEFQAPAATTTSTPDVNGFTPKPTDSPVVKNELKKRDTATALYWHCGWWSNALYTSSSKYQGQYTVFAFIDRV